MPNDLFLWHLRFGFLVFLHSGNRVFGQALTNRKFQFVDEGGIVVRSGVTDAEGKTGLYKSQLIEGLRLKIIPEDK